MCTLFEKLNDHFWRALLFIVHLLQYDSHDFQQLDLFPLATGSRSSSLICIAVSGMYLFPLNNATVGITVLKQVTVMGNKQCLVGDMISAAVQPSTKLSKCNADR